MEKMRLRNLLIILVVTKPVAAFILGGSGCHSLTSLILLVVTAAFLDGATAESERESGNPRLERKAPQSLVVASRERPTYTHHYIEPSERASVTLFSVE
jgi:hypothetical protein